MTVQDAIDMLSKYDRTLQLIIQKDAEGSEFSPLDSLEKSNYLPETTWAGTKHEKETKSTRKAIFLVPVN